jgi:hypothetical protein
MSGGGRKTVNTMPKGRCYSDEDCTDNNVCYRENENDPLGYCVSQVNKEKIETNKKLMGESSENLAKANMSSTAERIKQQQTIRRRRLEEEESIEEQRKRGEARENILRLHEERSRESAERDLRSIEDTRSALAASYEKDLKRQQKMKEEREKELKEQQDSISRLQDTITSNRALLSNVENEQNRLYRRYGITPEEDIYNACPICQTSIDDVGLKYGLETGSIVRPGCCSGVFHKNCVLSWFNQATNRKRFLCPQCKINGPKWVNMCIRLKYGNDSELIGDDLESSRSNVERFERRINDEMRKKEREEREEREEARRMRYNQNEPGIPIRSRTPDPSDHIRPPDAVVRERLIDEEPRATGGWYSESSPNRGNRPRATGGWYSESSPNRGNTPSPPSRSTPPAPTTPPPVPDRPNNERIDELERGVTSMATNLGWRGLPSVDNVERWRASHPFMPYTDNLNDREIIDVYGNITYPMSQVVMRGNMTGRMYTVYYTLYDNSTRRNNDYSHVIFAVLAEYSPTSESSIGFMRGETIAPMYLGIVSLSTWNRERMNGDLDALLYNTRDVNMNFTTYGMWVNNIVNNESFLSIPEEYREMLDRMRNDERIRRRRLYIIVGEPLNINYTYLFDGETHENIAIYNNNHDSLHNAIGTMYEALYEQPDSSIYLETAAPAYTQAATNTYTREAQAETRRTTPPPRVSEPFNFDGTITGDLRQMEDDGDVLAHYQSVSNIPVGENGSTDLVILEIEDGDVLLIRQNFASWLESSIHSSRYIITSLMITPSLIYGDMGRMELRDWLHDHDGQTEDSIFTRNQILDDVELTSTINELIRYAYDIDLLVGGSDTTEDRYVFIYDYGITERPRDEREFLYIGRYNTFEHFRTAVMRLKRVILGPDSSDSSSGMSDRSLGSTRASTVVGSAFEDASDEMSVVSDVSHTSGIGGKRKTRKRMNKNKRMRKTKKGNKKIKKTKKKNNKIIKSKKGKRKVNKTRKRM